MRQTNTDLAKRIKCLVSLNQKFKKKKTLMAAKHTFPCHPTPLWYAETLPVPPQKASSQSTNAQNTCTYKSSNKIYRQQQNNNNKSQKRNITPHRSQSNTSQKGVKASKTSRQDGISSQNRGRDHDRPSHRSNTAHEKKRHTMTAVPQSFVLADKRLSHKRHQLTEHTPWTLIK